MSFHNNNAIFIVDTFELSTEIDKERVLKAKYNAEEILKKARIIQLNILKRQNYL